MKRKLSRLLFFIIMLFFVFDAIKTALNFREVSKKIEADQTKLEALKKENENLKITLEKVKSTRFLEDEARNKLNLSLPGETTVIGK